MPFKRKGSPNYQIRKWNLAGYGDTGAISSGTTDKSVAERMEHLLVDLANKALIDPTWRNLLDAICDHKVKLSDALTAKNTGRLETLKLSLTDPLISDAVQMFKAGSDFDKPTRIGLDELIQMAGSERLGVLTGRRITEMCVRAQKLYNQKRNTVHRQLLRAISLLLRFHIGNAERNRIFADVRFSAEDDTREVHLSPLEIANLLQACDDLNYHEVHVMVKIALQTSADRGTLLHGVSNSRVHRGLRKRDITIYRDERTNEFFGEIFLHDTKTDSRSRTVPITDLLCRELLALVRNKAPDDTVFSFKYPQFDYRWNRIRKKAGFWNEEKGFTLRFKDLRAQSSIYGEEAGIPQTVLSKTYGHTSDKMIRRYQQRNAVMTKDQAKQLEERMFAPSSASTNKNTNTG
ncbi:MAG: hypothetical protein AAF564_17740 [Bacteroidota bacterium]